MHYSSIESAKTVHNVYHISLKRHATSLITADCISLCSVNNLTNNKILLIFQKIAPNRLWLWMIRGVQSRIPNR